MRKLAWLGLMVLFCAPFRSYAAPDLENLKRELLFDANLDLKLIDGTYTHVVKRPDSVDTEVCYFVGSYHKTFQNLSHQANVLQNAEMEAGIKDDKLYDLWVELSRRASLTANFCGPAALDRSKLLEAIQDIRDQIVLIRDHVQTPRP